MIMTQEPVILKAQDQFEQVQHFIRQTGSEGRRIDQVESDLWGRMLPLGRHVLEGCVAGYEHGAWARRRRMTVIPATHRTRIRAIRCEAKVFFSFSRSFQVATYTGTMKTPKAVQTDEYGMMRRHLEAITDATSCQTATSMIDSFYDILQRHTRLVG